MKFRKKHTNATVFMAMLHGIVIGIAAVAIIGFILGGTSGKKTGAKPEEELPISGPKAEEKETVQPTTGNPLQLFARQHGVFSTPATAATFIAGDPALATAAIIRSGNQYFVWTAVGLTESEIPKSENVESFLKTFNADASACQEMDGKKLQDVLAAEDIAKIKSSESGSGDENMAEFNRHIDAITAFTDDLRVIRLHLLSHYSYAKDCVKISF